MHLKPLLLIIILAAAALSPAPITEDLDVAHGSNALLLQQGSNTVSVAKTTDAGVPGQAGAFTLTMSDPPGSGETDPIDVGLDVSGTATHVTDYSFRAGGKTIVREADGSIFVPFQPGGGKTVLLEVVPKAPATVGKTVTVTVVSDSPIIGAYVAAASPDDTATMTFKTSTAPGDADEDGVPDSQDQCPSTAAGASVDANGCSGAQRDTDGDGKNDDVDQCPGTPSGESVNDAGCAEGQLDEDADGDGIKNGVDNCPAVANANQLDADGDGIGDACDDDVDGDDVPDSLDNCPSIANPKVDHDNDPTTPSIQPDMDGDGIGDVCDDDKDGDGLSGCRDLDDSSKDGIADRDLDCDGIADPADNCPNLYNPDQKNTDATKPPAIISDTRGDVCDDDIDGDGIRNADDLLPLSAASDWDKDGVPDGDTTLNSVAGPDQCQGGKDSANLDKANTAKVPNWPDACDVDQDGDGVPDKVATGSTALPRFATSFSVLAPSSGGDNCPKVANANQADADGDGIGDACEGADNDGDGVPNDLDAFPDDPNEWADSDGDGIGDNADTCPLGHGGDSDGDGIPNACDPIDDRLTPEQLAALARTMAGTTSGSMVGKTVTAGTGLKTNITYTAAPGAETASLYRADSPFVLVASQAASVGKFTDEAGAVGSTYVITVTFTSGGATYGEINTTNDQGTLEAMVGDGNYYEVLAPAATKVANGVKKLPAITLLNSNPGAETAMLRVVLYDADGGQVRVQTFAVQVPGHGNTTADLSTMDLTDAASYEVFRDTDDGEVLLASGTIKAPRLSLETSFLWLVAGGVLLTLIITMAIVGMVSYRRNQYALE